MCEPKLAYYQVLFLQTNAIFFLRNIDDFNQPKIVSFKR